MLREKIGGKRAIATILGFIGVVLVSEIDGYGVDVGVLLGLGSALAAAILIFQNRLLVKTEHTATIKTLPTPPSSGSWRVVILPVILDMAVTLDMAVSAGAGSFSCWLLFHPPKSWI